MRVEVTAHHLAHGYRTHFANPIALALQEIDPFVVVTRRCIHTRDHIYGLPLRIQLWLEMYFDVRFVEPITFEVVL